MENTNIYSSDEEAFNMESSRLVAENLKLRKLIELMQEDVELHCTLKEHKRKAEIITPPGQHKKGRYDLREEAQMVNSGPRLDPEKVKKCQRIVGEMAFQLDRRILWAIFLAQQRLYGYYVPYIKEKIIQVTRSPTAGKVDEKLRCELFRRYNHTMDELRKFGYNPAVHPLFTAYIVNTYGITKDRHAKTEDLSSYNDPQYLNKMITECMPRDIVKDIIIILNCLVYFAREDGKSLLI
ncbi:speriolin-like protein isoform X1 [Anomaloglossus baeobatrachus]|uniref:speriolin-like protein isoform X1 n=1 Tax=Anomaloglossus baeobatrachus TaxID=238106 RepID=UPI003F4FC8C3